MSDFLIVGDLAGATGAYSLSAGSLSVGGDPDVGFASGSSGTFTQSGGTALVVDVLTVGVSGSGTYTQTGAPICWAPSTWVILLHCQRQLLVKRRQPVGLEPGDHRGGGQRHLHPDGRHQFGKPLRRGLRRHQQRRLLAGPRR